jgi:hypothetical protein
LYFSPQKQEKKEALWYFYDSKGKNGDFLKCNHLIFNRINKNGFVSKLRKKALRAC